MKIHCILVQHWCKPILNSDSNWTRWTIEKKRKTYWMLRWIYGHRRRGKCSSWPARPGYNYNQGPREWGWWSCAGARHSCWWCPLAPLSLGTMRPRSWNPARMRSTRPLDNSWRSASWERPSGGGRSRLACCRNNAGGALFGSASSRLGMWFGHPPSSKLSPPRPMPNWVSTPANQCVGTAASWTSSPLPTKQHSDCFLSLKNKPSLAYLLLFWDKLTRVEGWKTTVFKNIVVIDSSGKSVH